MNKKSPNSEKPPQTSSSATKQRKIYSTHPRVQRAFRRLVNWKKKRAQRTPIQDRTPANSAGSDQLTPSEIEALQFDKKKKVEQMREYPRKLRSSRDPNANPNTSEQ